MRFKPPPPNSDIGWRVEFRPMEVRHVLPLRSSLLTTPHPPNVLLRGLWVHSKAVGIQMCLWIATPKATGSWYQSVDLERGLQPQRGTMKVLRNNAVWRAREGEAGAGSRSLTVWSSLLGAANRLWELGLCGVCGSAHQGDPLVQTGFPHPTVQGNDGWLEPWA